MKLKTDVSLLLDLDRTLVDVQSYTSYEAAVADVEREMGTIELVGVPDTEWRSATVTAMATLVALTGDPERWQQASDLIEEHEIAAVASARAMKGLRRFLAATSTMPRAIVTLMGQSATRQVCERFQIDVAVQVGRSVELAPKPAPDQVLRACRLLDVVPDEAVMVGDSTWDLSAASAAGAGFVGLTNGRLSEFPRGTKVATSLNAVLAELR
ncbi:MAG: HAD-IA family hydrolase [Actinomycetota bacterium]|nr:HAD-IA family hydrolase [Actinomycetota bacterium]